MQHIYQCDKCDGMMCTLIVTCNDDKIPDDDDIPCIHGSNIFNEVPNWVVLHG